MLGLYSQHDVGWAVRGGTVLEVVISLQQVETIAGAMRVYVAEHQGLRRRVILQAADRRIAQLRQEEAPWVPRLEIEGRGVGADEIAWEQQHSDTGGMRNGYRK